MTPNLSKNPFFSLAVLPLFLLSLLPFPTLSQSLHLRPVAPGSHPSALILLCTVLLQMRQARRLSNPCIQRYTSRIGECSSTYVSSSKSPLQAISSPFQYFLFSPPLSLAGALVVDICSFHTLNIKNNVQLNFL